MDLWRVLALRYHVNDDIDVVWIVKLLDSSNIVIHNLLGAKQIKLLQLVSFFEHLIDVSR